jgi:hypothetical protein
MNIICVHRDIPKDLTLFAEERLHPPLPHLVALPIEVRRTRTPFQVCNLWILEWLESMNTEPALVPIEEPIRRTREGGVNGSR